MESLILTANIVVLIIVLWYSVKHEKSPDKPEMGPFRIKTEHKAETLDDKKSKKSKI